MQLFHIAERLEWEAALALGRYEVSTRGRTLAEGGFIHCSLAPQVRGVAERFYADADDLVLLVIDAERLRLIALTPTPECDNLVR